MAPKERFQEMNMNCKNSRGWLGVGVFLLAALALPACTHRHIHTAGPPAHAPAHGYYRHGIHSARVVGLRITFIAVGGRVIVLADGTYVNQHGHYIVISGGYVHELGGIPPGQIVAASRRRGPRHGYPPGHSKVKFKVKKVKMHGGRLSFVGPDGGTLVFPAGIYKNKRGHQIIVDDGHVRTLVLAANEPSRAATPSTPSAGRPSHADRRPVHADEHPARSDDRPTRADERSGRGDEHPSRADRRPTAAQPIEHGACWKTEIRGDVATRKVIPCPDNPKASATKPAIKKTRPSRSDERTTRADRRPTRSDERTTRNTGRSGRSDTSSDRGDARSTNAETSRRPASSAGRASDSSERGAAPAGRSTAQSRKSAAEPSKRGTAQTRKPAAEPSKKRVSGKKDCKESSEKSKSGGSSKKKPCKESSK
jgi:hypothetical protein